MSCSLPSIAATRRESTSSWPKRRRWTSSRPRRWDAPSGSASCSTPTRGSCRRLGRRWLHSAPSRRVLPAPDDRAAAGRARGARRRRSAERGAAGDAAAERSRGRARRRRRRSCSSAGRIRTSASAAASRRSTPLPRTATRSWWSFACARRGPCARRGRRPDGCGLRPRRWTRGPCRQALVARGRPRRHLAPGRLGPPRATTRFRR